MTTSQTLYIPITSPPTPAPSPGPVTDTYHQHHEFQPTPFPPSSMMNTQNPAMRRHFLSSVISSCTPHELLFISQTITLLLKRDFMHSLPIELALYTLTFVDEPKTLTRASQVSKHWRTIVEDESVWRRMCQIHGFDDWDLAREVLEQLQRKRLRNKSKAVEEDIDSNQMSKGDLTSKRRTTTKHSQDISFSYRRHFKTSYIIRTSSDAPLVFLSFLILIQMQTGEKEANLSVPIVSPSSLQTMALSLLLHWIWTGSLSALPTPRSKYSALEPGCLPGHSLVMN